MNRFHFFPFVRHNMDPAEFPCKSWDYQVSENLYTKYEIKAEVQTKSEYKIELKEERDSNTEASSCESRVAPVLAPIHTLNVPKNFDTTFDRPYIQLPLREQLRFNAYLLKELERMVRFIISNMGRDNKPAIDTMRNEYLENVSLLQIYDKLVMKYYSAKKSKEDIIRYILRKALKVMKTSIGAEAKVCGKKASLLLCKRLFQSSFNDMEEAGVNIENGDEILEFILPYNKKSRNRTMNSNFIVEIFSSEKFCQEYEKFLKSFHEIIEEDNDKKIEKIVGFLAECVKKDCISKFSSFNRLPWLEVWIESTEKIALSFLFNKTFPKTSRRGKEFHNL